MTTCAILMADTETTIIYVNRAAEGIFGYTASEMLGQKLGKLLPGHPGHPQPAPIEGCADAARGNVAWTSQVIEGVRKNGERIPLEISVGEFIQNGKPVFAGIIRDVTERKRTEDAVRESELKTKEVEALHRIDQLRKDLIATVSHELRNPLASIKGYISTLLQTDVAWDPEQQREFLEIANQEADRLNRLVGDLLTMSQLEAGALKLERNKIDSLVKTCFEEVPTI